MVKALMPLVAGKLGPFLSLPLDHFQVDNDQVGRPKEPKEPKDRSDRRDPKTSLEEWCLDSVLRDELVLLQRKLLSIFDLCELFGSSSHEAVFLFDEKERLLFVHDPPYNLKLEALGGRLDLQSQLLPMQFVFKSKALIQEVQQRRLERTSAKTQSSDCPLRVRCLGNVKKEKAAFYVLINPEVFIQFELGNWKREGSPSRFHNKPNLAPKVMQAVSWEPKGQHENGYEGGSEGDSGDDGAMAEELEDKVEIPESLSIPKAQNIKANRHSLAVSSDSQRVLFDNLSKKLGKKPAAPLQSGRLLYEKLKNSYAMEFLPKTYDSSERKDDGSPSERRRGGVNSSILVNMIKSKEDSELQRFVDSKPFPSFEEAEADIPDLVLVDWSHDILQQTETQDFGLILRIFRPHLTALAIDTGEFLAFAVRCKYWYERNKNPFHNFKHGVSVLFSSNHFHAKIDYLRNNFAPHTTFAFLLAALGHDLDHTGKNNVFEINTRSKLAMKYNDQSPLEQHHIRTLFKAINTSESPILKGLDFQAYFEARALIIECILATDMKVHFSLIKKFESLIGQAKQMTAKEEKGLCLSMVVHSADISASAKNIEVAQQWSLLISREFTAQYQLEQQHGIPLTPYFKDLDVPANLWKSEISFLRFIVQPLFELLGKYDFEVSEEKTEDSPLRLQAKKYYGKINEIIQTNIGIYERKLSDNSK
jgi:hypothetical protein